MLSITCVESFRVDKKKKMITITLKKISYTITKAFYRANVTIKAYKHVITRP